MLNHSLKMKDKYTILYSGGTALQGRFRGEGDKAACLKTSVRGQAKASPLVLACMPSKGNSRPEDAAFVTFSSFCRMRSVP